MNADFTDREMWIAIRSGLLGIVKAMEVHSAESALAVAIRACLLGITDAIERRFNIQKRSH